VIAGSEKVNGLACDIEDNGALILRLANGTVRRVFVGDVSVGVNP
jgi:biotin-(acetyl-CoA carboxylase) ligase